MATVPSVLPARILLNPRAHQGSEQDPPIRAQPSGAAGLNGLLAASFEPSLSGPLGLDGESRVLIFGSEGPPEVQDKESSP